MFVSQYTNCCKHEGLVCVCVYLCVAHVGCLHLCVCVWCVFVCLFVHIFVHTDGMCVCVCVYVCMLASSLSTDGTSNERLCYSVGCAEHWALWVTPDRLQQTHKRAVNNRQGGIKAMKENEE